MLTVLGLEVISGNHCLDDFPEVYSIDRNQAHLIRAYFHNNSKIHCVKELYSEFPGVFQGESRGHLEEFIEDPEKLGVPLF